jgi:hypothetical protein
MFSSSSSSSSNRSSSNGVFKPICLEDIDIKWRTNETPITAIKLLTRGLNGLGVGAVHTSLLFETNIEYLTVEYGDGGMDARYYPKKTKEVEAYTEIMGKKNHVDVYDITQCFEYISSLKLKKVYASIDALKDEWTAGRYSILDCNCRHFVQFFCHSLSCNKEGLDFLDDLRLNVPDIVKPFVGLFLWKRVNNGQKYYVGYWTQTSSNKWEFKYEVTAPNLITI